MRVLRAGILLWLGLSSLRAQVAVAGRVVDENRTAVAEARIEFRNPAYAQAPAVTSDEQGRFRLELSQPGEYSLRAQRQGFFVLDNVRVQLNSGANEVTVTLNHLQEFVESIDVVYSPPVVDPAQTSDQKQLNNLEILGVPYPASQDIHNALPMFPGVVQDTTGLVHVNGGSSDQASVTLNGFNISDPVTGLFDARAKHRSRTQPGAGKRPLFGRHRPRFGGFPGDQHRHGRRPLAIRRHQFHPQHQHAARVDAQPVDAALHRVRAARPGPGVVLERLRRLLRRGHRPGTAARPGPRPQPDHQQPFPGPGEHQSIQHPDGQLSHQLRGP